MEITIDGERRKLDLCAEHLAELRRTMRPWLRQATSGGTSRPAAKAGKSTAKRTVRATDAAEVRAWAKQNGWKLPARGRIPTAVREAFAAR